MTYSVMSAFLFWTFINFNNLNIKIFSGFFFLYYFIPLPNISTYRGTIVYETLMLYTLMILIGLLPIIFKGYSKINLKKTITKIEFNTLFKNAVTTHLLLVYLLLLIIYIKFGNVVLNQELRFKIPTVLGYLIKSTIYIPLFVTFIINTERRTFKSVFPKYIFLPLLPAILIGSRGTVILVIISLALLIIITNTLPGERYNLKTSIVWKRKKKLIYKLATLSIFIIYFFYYIRRFFSDKLLSNMGVIEKFFSSNNPIYLLILPIYASFRETIGLANVLVKNHYQNSITQYPLFFQELTTVLPGEQMAPGKVIGQIVGSSLDAGLTPGILGGLYLDYKNYSIFGCLVFTLIINRLYNKSMYNEYSKILYVITLTQFFHLFHRGFLKPEYIMAYAIIFFYFVILKTGK